MPLTTGSSPKSRMARRESKVHSVAPRVAVAATATVMRRSERP